ncbi:MAG: SET domain-containing protein [Sphingobacteriales bacterium]|nr:MAG: SET domain-containing protein [Sphingobacteriales bacterium]
MAIKKKDLEIRTSTIPGAGNGLFTKVFIPKGTRIIEYTGKVTSWKDANHADGKNAYIFFINRNNVIDALRYKSSLARYANDARGLTRVKGIKNNCEYIIEKKRVYIDALRDIPEGSEILVSYGQEYWDTIKALLRERKEN